MPARRTVLAIAFLLAGCSATTLTDEQVLSLRTGQTPEQVLRILDEPASRFSGRELDDGDALGVFGPALLEHGVERLEWWSYISFDVEGNYGNHPDFEYHFGYLAPDSTTIREMRFLDLHFLDGRLLRNDRQLDPEIMSRVEVGMTYTEVQELLGPPLLKVLRAETFWVYRWAGDKDYIHFPAAFDSGVLTHWPWDADGS